MHCSYASYAYEGTSADEANSMGGERGEAKTEGGNLIKQYRRWQLVQDRVVCDMNESFTNHLDGPSPTCGWPYTNVRAARATPARRSPSSLAPP